MLLVLISSWKINWGISSSGASIHGALDSRLSDTPYLCLTDYNSALLPGTRGHSLPSLQMSIYNI